MTTVGPLDRTFRDRVAHALGPEVIAVILITILMIGGLLVAVTSSGLGAARPNGPGPSSGGLAVAATASPTDGVPTNTATPTHTLAPSVAPTPTTSPSPTPTVVASPTLVPSSASTPPPWSGDARIVLKADESLIAFREQLRSELAAEPRDTTRLAPLLRSTSAAILTALGTIGTLAAGGAPVDLVDRLLAPHDAAQTIALTTLGSGFSIQDLKALKGGATKLVAALEPLEPLMRDVAMAAGLDDPVPDWSPAPGASSASPSATP